MVYAGSAEINGAILIWRCYRIYCTIRIAAGNCQPLAAGNKFLDKRDAKFGPAFAAVFDKEERQCAECIQVGAVDDRTTATIRCDQP